MSFNVGESVGPYRIIEQLGQGGMATVYKAYHAALDRYVALKVLHPAFNQDANFTMRFQREARVVAKLDHPHIVPIYDYAEHENRPYLVMKFIEGETLKARFGRGALSTEELNLVVEAVGSALAYAHKKGILHRDIKPSNVLIGTDGVMYLADFGLARIAEAGESTLSSDSIMGTPQYISPEQAMGKKDLDAGTDIYSFGVVLYELVVGQVPFNADTPFSIIHDHIYTPLPMPMEINPKVPETVQRVLLKALAKDRKDRYETVGGLVKAFREAWSAAGVPMRGTLITLPPSTLQKAARAAQKSEGAQIAGEAVTIKEARKKKRPIWAYAAGGVLILLLCTAAVLAFRQGGFFGIIPPLTPAVIKPTRTPQPTQVASPTASATDTAVPMSPSPTDISADITAAKEGVAKHPSDPDAHLTLALAYWDEKLMRPALEELTQAANLAGPRNRVFFLKAADKFKSRQAWVAAAGMYLRAIQTYTPGQTPEELTVDFREAVYMAAAQPEMPLYLFFERIDDIDQPLGFIARSRHALYNGNLEDAKINLDNAKQLKPDTYEVVLLEAEINIKDGHPERAQPILLSLASDLGVPEWIRSLADQLIHSL
jgi:serine/threonine protein kinase